MRPRRSCCAPPPVRASCTSGKAAAETTAMHNLELTAAQPLTLDTVRKFVRASVGPRVLDLDEHRRFAGDALSGLAEIGLFGLSVAEAAGGAGMGLVPLAAALEE